MSTLVECACNFRSRRKRGDMCSGSCHGRTSTDFGEQSSHFALFMKDFQSKTAFCHSPNRATEHPFLDVLPFLYVTPFMNDDEQITVCRPGGTRDLPNWGKRPPSQPMPWQPPMIDPTSFEEMMARALRRLSGLTCTPNVRLIFQSVLYPRGFRSTPQNWRPTDTTSEQNPSRERKHRAFGRCKGGCRR